VATLSEKPIEYFEAGIEDDGIYPHLVIW